MQITVDLKGEYAWAPPQLEPGTKLDITQADVTALRAKQMADDSWHLRHEVKRETQWSMGPHEPSICQQMCGAVLKGEEKSRAEVVTSEFIATMKHHAPRKFIVAVHVHDDGPDLELMKATMILYNVPEDAREELLALYAKPEDVAAHIAGQLKIKKHAAPNVAGSKE